MSSASYVDSVALTFKTKQMSAADITSNIGIEPSNFANAGENNRHLPLGKIVKTGIQTWTSWSRIFEIEHIDDSYDMEKRVMEIIELCEPHTTFITNILQCGGIAEIQIRLAGSHNIGDVFSAATLRRFSDLGMSLSIEVFP